MLKYRPGAEVQRFLRSREPRSAWTRRVEERRKKKREKLGGRGVFIPSQWLKATRKTAVGDEFDLKGKAPKREGTQKGRHPKGKAPDRGARDRPPCTNGFTLIPGIYIY